MTNEEKAVETLVWIEDYIKSLPNSKLIKGSPFLLVILDRVEAALKE